MPPPVEVVDLISTMNMRFYMLFKQNFNFSCKVYTQKNLTKNNKKNETSIAKYKKINILPT